MHFINSNKAIILRSVCWAVTFVFISLIFATSIFGAPAWWTNQDVFQDGFGLDDTSEDHSAANVGQLMYMATKANQEIEHVRGYTYPPIENMVTGVFPTVTNRYAAINIGQLKAVAKPFYDLLSVDYPWSDENTNEYAIANIGQLKHVFNFEVAALATASVINVVLHPQDSDFEEGMEGRVMISAKHDDHFYTAVKTTKDNKVAQTEDGKIQITAHLTPAAAGWGKRVYFRVVTPDPDDKSPYETDTDGGDNQDTNNMSGELSSTSDVAVRKTINGVEVAAAEVKLTITDRYAGDNYQVECSLDPDFSEVSSTTSVMIAWKRYYMEVDRMYNNGSNLATNFTPDVDSEPDSITVEDASTLAVNDEIIVFDADNPEGENAKVVDISGNLLTLDVDLANAYNVGYSPGSAAAVAKPSDGLIDDGYDMFGLTTSAFGHATDGSDGGAFVELRFIEGSNAVPYISEFSDIAELKAFSYLWCKNLFKKNCMHVVACNKGYSGFQSGTTVVRSSYVCVGNLKETKKEDTEAHIQQVTVHEIGHVFLGSSGTDRAHPDFYLSYLGHEVDKCLMSYNDNKTNGVAKFCHEPPNHVDKIRDSDESKLLGRK